LRGKNNSDQERYEKCIGDNASELHNPAWHFFLTRI